VAQFIHRGDLAVFRLYDSEQYTATVPICYVSSSALSISEVRKLFGRDLLYRTNEFESVALIAAEMPLDRTMGGGVQKATIGNLTLTGRPQPLLDLLLSRLKSKIE